MPVEQGYQLVAFSGDDVRTFDLPRSGIATIGRSEDSTVRIDEPSVSRKHALLRIGDVLEIEDLGRANGTLVRRMTPAAQGSDTVNVGLQHLVQRSARLAVGDCLLFGTVCVALRHQPRVEIPDLIAGDLSPGAPVVVMRDPAMQALYAEALRAARANINILITGETGVGKEVLARAIHHHSPRAKGPFVGINCAALAESLLESELFGSEKGAFTGALTRAGLFEAGKGGTVFLDEVGELPVRTQAKLLRVLEERAVTRLGATRALPIDVRFLAATNRDVEADVREGRLRPDLFFRLNAVALAIPPLRERPLEIELLAKSFLTVACRGLERGLELEIGPAALDLLRAHLWPGNVRELRNAVERAAVMCSERTILPEHLPPGIRAAVRKSAPPATKPALPQTLQDEMKELESARILEALDRCGGNQSEAARQLGMPRRTLVSRLRELGVGRRPSPVGRPE